MRVPITVYAEMTPNPKAIKFVASRELVKDGKVYEFFSSDETGGSPLAKILFTFPFVQGVMISQNFVTISIKNNLDWNEMVLEVRDYLTNYFQAGQPVLNLLDKQVRKEEQNEFNELKPLPKSGEVFDIEKKIKHILREYVSPAVENDGGAVSFESFVDGELKVRLSGACNGCPSSNQTLQYGIQNIFGKFLPQVKKVTSI